MEIKLENGKYIIGAYSIAGNYDDGYTVWRTEDGENSETRYDDMSFEGCVSWVLNYGKQNTILIGDMGITDKEKFIRLFTELGIDFKVYGNTIYIDRFYCDCAITFGVSFCDGEYCPEGEFHEFFCVPEVI